MRSSQPLAMLGIEGRAHLSDAFGHGWIVSNVESGLTGAVPDSLVETVGQGIGVTALAAQTLPADVAAVVSEAANLAFVDAFTSGLFVSAGFMLAATLASLLLIPWRNRTRQVERDDVSVPANTR